jgi:hypothetical protein
MHTNGDILEFTAENNEPKLSPGNLTEFGHLSEAINARIDSTTGAKLKLEAYLETKTTNFVGITREGLDYCLSNYPDPTAEATDKSAREILISSAFLYEGEVAHAYEIDVDVDHEHLSKIAAMRCDSDLLDFFLDSYPQIDSCGGDEGGSLLRWYLPGLNASIEMENGSPKLFCINTRANKLPEARLALSYTIELARLIKNERKSFVSQHDNAKQIYGQLQDAHTTLESSTDTKTKSSFDQILNACRDTRTDLEAFFYSLAEKLVAIETAIYFLTFLTAEHGVPSPAGMNYDDTGWHWKENAITECQLKLQKKEPIGEAEKYTYSNIQIEFRNE